MALLAAAVWVVLLAITGQQTECFNLDQSDNVVRFFTGGNEQNSLFGFSLTPYSFSDNHTRYVYSYTKPEKACKFGIYCVALFRSVCVLVVANVHINLCAVL